MSLALDQYNLPNALLTQVLASNPSAAKSDNIRKAMDDRLEPFDEWQEEQIMAGIGVMSNKEQLESELSGYLSQRDAALTGLIGHILKDSLETDPMLSILGLLSPETYFGDLLYASLLRADRGEYSAASALLSQAPNLFRLRQPELDDLGRLNDIYAMEQQLAGAESPQLSESQKGQLEEVMDYGSALSIGRALRLLTSYSDYVYHEPVIEDSGEPKSLYHKKPGSKKDPALKVYPNPSDGMLTVECKTPDWAGWELTDAAGRKVMTGAVPWGALQAVLDITPLKGGFYTLKAMGLSGNVIESIPVIKQ